MKKKFLLLGMAVMMVFALAACGAPKDERTLDTFKTAFEKGGIVLEMAVKENSILANMPKNGKFVLDTNDEQATEIFNNVAK